MRVERGLRWPVEQPGVQDWWHEWGTQFEDEFQRFMDGLIREAEAAG